jgi:sarcosine oxidase/L-pipecolate oxidase
MGAWTPLLLPELKENCLPTGQTVAVIQLTKEEQETYKTVPVSLCMDTGFYCFPPTDTGLLKFGTESIFIHNSIVSSLSRI